jgi:uncharacterized protein DUF4440
MKEMSMKLANWLYGCLVVLALSPGVALAEACSGRITAEEALTHEDARYAAQTSNDFAAMERLFGDELVYIHSTAVVDGKKEYIETMRSGRVKYRSMRRTGETLRDYGCIAIITGTANFDVTVEGKDLSVELKFTSTWAKRADRIQFIGWQATRVPPKQ